MNGYGYQTPIKKKSKAADFRRTAWEALKNRWWLAIGMGALTSVLGGAATSGFSGSFSYGFSSEGIEGAGELALWQILLLVGVFGFLMLIAVGQVIFVGGAVNVGYARFNLGLIDGEEKLTPLHLFSGFRFCYWKAVKVYALLTLIQAALSLIILVPFSIWALVFIKASGAHMETFTLPLLLTTLVMLLSIFLYIAVSVFVTYRFALCNFILAEYPTLDAMDVLRNSASLMKGNKWRLFCLELSFTGWILLGTFCTCGIGIFFVSPYMSAASAAFYSEVSGRDMAREVEFPSVNPEDYYQF